MDDLDAAIALVYAQPPSGFVTARGALVKELKAAKRKEDAAAITALRRPTKQAWAVGEAVRRAPEPAAAYFAAIEALSGPGGDLRQRTADLRTAVTALVEAIEGVDGGDATAALLATAADPGATDALRRGRLAEVPVAGGFGGLSLGVGPAAPPQEADDGDAAGDGPAASAGPPEATAPDDATAAEQVEAAQAAIGEAQAARDRASQALDDAREAATAASARLQEAQG